MKKILSILALLMTAATGAWADDYTITLPTVSNGSVVAKVSDVSVTSAAAGATVSLVATPDAGYKLKTISGTYQGGPEETLSGSNHPATLSGTYFTLNSSARTNARWNLYNSTITITSKDDGIKIDRVVFNLNYKGNQFNASLLSADKGTLSVSGNTLTVTSINSSSVTITSTANSAKGCGTDQVTIYGTGTVTVDKTLTLTSTGDANVKTFTMPSSNVTVSAEFELAPVNLTANSDGAATPSYWATYYNGTTSYTADANTTVYKAAMNGTSSLTLTEVADIPAGQAVILKSSAATITLTPAASTTADLSDNVLLGGTSVTSDYDAYTLSRGADGTGTVGFYKFNGGALDGSKAHLEIPSSSPAPARGFFGFGDDGTTAIEAPTATIIVEDGEIYDLMGRRIEGQPTRKGIYVKNGQKFIVK